MANIRYRQIVGNKDLLRNLLIVNQVPLSEAARRLDVPYNSLRFQAKSCLSSEEWEQVDYNRTRRSYPREFKVEVMRAAIALEKKYRAENNGRAWGKAFREVSKKFEVPTEILYAWRKSFLKELHPEKYRDKTRNKPLEERGEVGD